MAQVHGPTATVLFNKRCTEGTSGLFWSREHWTRAVQEGGRGLIDLRSRIKTFPTQTRQRFYIKELVWTGAAV